MGRLSDLLWKFHNVGRFKGSKKLKINIEKFFLKKIGKKINQKLPTFNDKLNKKRKADDLIDIN